MIPQQTFNANDYQQQLQSYLAQVMAKSPPVQAKGAAAPQAQAPSISPNTVAAIGSKLFGGGTSAAAGQVVKDGVVFDVASGAPVATAAPAAETTLANFAGTATPYLGAAGTAVGAYNAIRGAQKGDLLQSALGGAGVGLGINMMGYALGPAGWAAMLAAPVVAAAIGKATKWGDKDRFKGEYNRAKKLRESGIDWQWNTTEPIKGRSKSELIAQALASGGNVDFAKSRDEGALTGKDLVGYSFLPEQFGKQFADASLDKRIAAAQMVADAKAVREHHGTMDYNQNLTPELKDKIKAFLEGK